MVRSRCTLQGVLWSVVTGVYQCEWSARLLAVKQAMKPRYQRLHAQLVVASIVEVSCACRLLQNLQFVQEQEMPLQAR